LKIGLLGVVLVLALCAWFDYGMVAEYYGDGPPYYGRTVNMDKWSSPLPLLAVVNLGALAVAGVIVRATVRRNRH
jgi:hypothetical protein